MGEYRMPSLGADMDAGTLRAWRIAPGDHVKRAQVVGEVETEKGIIELEIWEDGIVDRLLVEPGTRVPVGTPLAVILSATATATAKSPALAASLRDAGSELWPPEADSKRRRSELGASPPTPTPSPSSPPTRAAARATELRASPAARQRARELGVDLASATATGPHGSITKDDVERAAPGKPASPKPPATAAPPPADKQAAMRRAIAAAMSRSKREIPHYYLATTIDAGPALRWLAEHNRTRPPAERILLAALILQGVARALHQVPELNGFYVDDSFHASEHVHVGVAISLRGGGLVAPALHDADTKPIAQIMADLSDLVARARAGTLRSSELADPTITVTNLGEQGVESTFGIIYPPQVALVGFGKVIDEPYAHDGMLGVRPTLHATLSADHRVTDGHRGGVFLSALKKTLEELHDP